MTEPTTERRVEQRVIHLENKLDAHIKHHENYEADLKKNNAMTESIFRVICGARSARSFIVWVVPVVAFFYEAWQFLKEHWK